MQSLESASRPAAHHEPTDDYATSKEHDIHTPAPKGNDAGSTLSYHPLSAIILIIWLAYIAVLLWLLERSSSAAKTTYPQSWWDKRVPSVLLTGFAQGHAAVTAMHLARLAISALHHDSTSPRSWAELFWLADRTWQGPVSFATTIYDKIHMKRVPRLSTTYVLFAITCFVALPTPYVLQRGYDEGLVEVPYHTSVLANTFTQDALPQLNAWMQMSAGEGAWVTGLPITDIYNSSLFLPDSLAHDEIPHDVVIAGSFIGMTISDLPAVEVQSKCDVYPAASMPDFENGIDPWCLGILPRRTLFYASPFTASPNIDDKIAWCLDFDYKNTKWMNTLEASTVTAYIALDASNGNQRTTGVVQCTSTFSLGTSEADGRSNRFSAFTRSSPSMDAGVVHPLYAALYDLTMPFTASGNNDLYSGVATERLFSILTMIGYTPKPGSTVDGSEYDQPTLEVFAAQLQRGTMCMGAAIGSLAKRPDQLVHNAVEYHSVSGRVRDLPYIWAARGLLILWLLLILYCSSRMFRPTIGPALGSYSAGRLLVNDPELVQSRPVGEMSENHEVRKPFGRVGDANEGGDMGHVAPGPNLPKLSRARSYGKARV